MKEKYELLKDNEELKKDNEELKEQVEKWKRAWEYEGKKRQESRDLLRRRYGILNGFKIM